MTYSQLRNSLPTQFTIPTLGGRADIEIHNPSFGHLIAVNSKGSSYHVTEVDWRNAGVIRSRNPRNPWASKHYTGLSSFFSYGLVHAAALLRFMEENDFEAAEDAAQDRLADAL